MLNKIKRGAAVSLALLLIFSVCPLVSLAEELTMPVIDFEDGTVQGFANRGDRDTAVIEVSGDEAHSGSKSLKTTGRTQSWNGPAVRVEKYITAGMEYNISVWVHALEPAAATNFILSTQVGDEGGASYVNILKQAVSAADGWVELSGTYLYSNTESGFITIYVENDNPTAEYYIDDISLTIVEGGGIQADLSLPSLKDIYKDYFLIGNVFSSQDLSGIRFDMLNHHFNVLTAENAMKPESVSTSKDTYVYGGTDKMISTAAGEGIKVHGHTLAWHQQSPGWLNKSGTTRAEAEANLKSFVSNVAGHYAGKLLSWDVLNEAMSDNPANPDDWRASLRISPWYEAFANGATGGESGADYIDMLFREARKADPDAILYYNDYNLNVQSKAAAVANMVKEINDAWIAEGNTRLLIEGVGMQGHYNVDTGIDDVEASIKRFSELGVEVSITELDVTVSGVSADEGLSEQAEQKQAATYAKLFVLFKKYADSIARVTFWGLDDGSSWRAAQFPQLFNANLSAKPAFNAVVDPEGFLESYDPGDEGGLRGIAVYGTPVVDGDIDDIWVQTEKLPIEKMLQAWNTASGTARALWDEENLYVLFEVSDKVLDESARNKYEQDTVEAFVGEENSKSGSYKTGDGQYRVSFTNTQSFGDTKYSEGFESAAKADGTSYIVEMKIPFKVIKPEVGKIIGFDAQINDGEDGKRIGISKWSDPTDNSWSSAAQWGELELLTEIPPPPVETVEPSPEPSPAPSPESSPEPEAEKSSSAPSKLIFVIVGGAAAIAVIAAVIFVLIRRKSK